MKVDYETNVKNALVVNLISSLKHRTTIPRLYIMASGRIQEYTKEKGKRYSQKEIDVLSEKLLLFDSKLVRILRTDCNFGIKSEISNLSYGAVYRLLARVHFKSIEFETPKDYNHKKPYVPGEPKNYSGKIKTSRDLTKRGNGTKRSTILLYP